MAKRFKTALVLSGGSARALTHLGVLQELQRHDFPIDLVVGTSMGAIIGALFAYYGDVGQTVEKMRGLLESDLFLRAVSVATEDVPEMGPDGFFNRFLWLFRRGVYYTHSMIRPTLVAEEAYLEIMNDLIPEHSIEDLALPFAAVAMDLSSGEEVILHKGSLRKAVAASAAIPGLLPPIEFNGRTLVDGGWVDNVPVAPAIALGAHFVLAVDSSLDTQDLGPLPTSAIESLFRCSEISRILMNRHRRSHADIRLIPQLGQMYWANFAALERCLAAGRAVVADQLDLIKHRRRQRQLCTLWGSLHPARISPWRHAFVLAD